MWVLEQALEVADQDEIVRLSREGRAIANLGVFLSYANQAKSPKTTWFNDFEHLLFKERAREEIKPEVAASFLHLHKLGKVPEWVCEAADLDLMRASASWLDNLNQN